MKRKIKGVIIVEVWCVTVFESGDFTTSVWGVHSTEEKAEAHKKELLEGELNNDEDGNYLVVEVTKHKVL